MPQTPSPKIDEYISNISDWRGQTLAFLRNLIAETAPELVEDFKWSVPVFTYKNSPVIAISAFKNHVKINFFNGAKLQDEGKLFNNGQDSKLHRSIDFVENAEINKMTLAKLILEAAKF